MQPVEKKNRDALACIKEFKEYLIENEKSAHTIEKYVRDVRCFLVWLYYRELTNAEVLAY